MARSELPDRREIADLPSLRAISDPLRLRILEELCDRERSVSELAEALRTTRHRLYYHVRLMERHGLIQETGTRTASGAPERLYRASARSFVISDEIAPALLSGTLATVFGQTLREVEAGVARQRTAGSADAPQVEVLRGVSTLPAGRHAEFVERVKGLVREFEEAGGARGRRYGLLVAMAPVLEDSGDTGRTG